MATTTSTTGTNREVAGVELLDPVDGASIIANTERLRPVIETEAGQVEAHGCLTPRMKEALVRAGCFRIGFSRRLGGPELTFHEQTRVIELLCSVDGSVGWNVKILSDSGFYASRLSERAAAQVYPSLDYATAGSFNPPGRARNVDGGYLVSGRWNFGSGIRSADQIIGGVHVFDHDEKVIGPNGPLVLGAFLPHDQVAIEDNWHVTGMRGSGSNSYSVPEVFVPEEHCFVRSADPKPEGDPLDKHVEFPFYNAVGITLGLARHALDITRARITGGPAPMSDRDGVQRLWGEAASYLDVARSHAYAVADQLDEVAFTPGRLLEPELFSRMIAMGPVTGELARRVVEIAVELIGSAAIYVDNPLERVVRDMHANLVHIQNQRRRWVDSAVWDLTGRPARR
ncbi:acyl-CoA dehydrogenase family protein [Nocardioides terrisoli]|uniref:acyl-CoA dehydrogenase family protein n=1 Tax=Nocardioides terrisoli TaxID=3388267 RepID=UPI00287B83BB|nr:acyl-CoA dehydrogenase family protein [Nocardioides marmorisolisilvae]